MNLSALFSIKTWFSVGVRRRPKGLLRWIFMPFAVAVGLYAIAAAVLGGCSLRGGEGYITGVIIGAALMQVLKNMINLIDAIPTNIEYAVIGAVILCGVATDEIVKRAAAKRKAAREFEAAKAS